MTPPSEETSPLSLAVTWIVVAVPLAWGIYQTAIKAVPLFRGPAASAAAGPMSVANPEKPAGVR